LRTERPGVGGMWASYGSPAHFRVDSELPTADTPVQPPKPCEPTADRNCRLAASPLRSQRPALLPTEQ
jgi:hypothetical protein